MPHLRTSQMKGGTLLEGIALAAAVEYESLEHVALTRDFFE